MFSSGWPTIMQDYPELAEKVKELCISKKN
jgi:hypothetical protein